MEAHFIIFSNKYFEVDFDELFIFDEFIQVNKKFSIIFFIKIIFLNILLYIIRYLCINLIDFFI